MNYSIENNNLYKISLAYLKLSYLEIINNNYNTSEKLFNKLYENANKVIIVLDGDAWEDAKKIYSKLNGGRLFGKIWIVKLPKDKDIADLRGDLTNYETKHLV